MNQAWFVGRSGTGFLVVAMMVSCGGGSEPMDHACAVEITAGGEHTCARTTDGSTWCWGWNGDGEVGNGTTEPPHRPFPEPVIPLGTSAVEIAAGYRHTCARKADGSVWCWGSNAYGQLGNGTDPSPVCDEHWPYCEYAKPSPSPVQVTGLGAAVEITAGKWHTCARKDDGSVWCWGLDYHGQLGDGTMTRIKPSPVQVAKLGASAVEIAAGSFHTCARKTDGSVWCWGSFGLPPSTSYKVMPVEVSALGTSAVEIAGGGHHTCVRMADGSVWCWGSNELGQLGDGTKPPPCEPEYEDCDYYKPPVPTLVTDAVEISAGDVHTCARKADGSVWCWGNNGWGQLGDAAADPITPSPVWVSALGTGAVEIAAGDNHTCARRADGSVWCWGAGSRGQIGNGATTIFAPPVQVALYCP